MSDGVEAVKNIHIWESEEWRALQAHAEETKDVHLRSLLQDAARSEAFVAKFDGIFLDYSRQRMTEKTLELLFALAKRAKLTEKMALMRGGAHINVTEDRAVMHTALRAPRGSVVEVDGHDVVPDVHAVLDRVQDFSDSVRRGMWRGATGEAIRSVVSIGIGGSYLGPEFVYEALRVEPTARGASEGRTLRFLANVDPVDVSRALEDLDPATTLVVVVSKTFTTAETMLNARTVRHWLRRGMEGAAEPATIIAKHMVAVSANVAGAGAFGIRPENVFGFWDWVGGRYSVCSAVGVVPLALHYGFPVVQRFLEGAHAMDRHFAEAPLRENLPALLGLVGVWNASFLGHPTRALLPYSQALVRFAAHIQQVDMESNGKRVAMDGTPLPFAAGEVNFGEPGTNGQHSFYQLMHQGQVVPADFIGFCEPQAGRFLPDEPVSNHDELMSNFFAQPDALAVGKTEADVLAEGAPAELAPHKVFDGNRPSSSILLPRLDAYACGQLLALYEHRTAVQGFLWGVCSFDQWGVELGKVLAKQVRNQLHNSRDASAKVEGFNPSTTRMLEAYLAHTPQPARRGSRSSFG